MAYKPIPDVSSLLESNMQPFNFWKLGTSTMIVGSTALFSISFSHHCTSLFDFTRVCFFACIPATLSLIPQYHLSLTLSISLSQVVTTTLYPSLSLSFIVTFLYQRSAPTSVPPSLSFFLSLYLSVSNTPKLWALCEIGAEMYWCMLTNLFLFIFVLFKQNINWTPQQYSNSNRWSKRQAPWPLHLTATSVAIFWVDGLWHFAP